MTIHQLNKPINSSFLNTWMMAARPQTLPAAIAPVVMATGMAFGDGIHHFPTALVALFGAISIQIGTNFVNDYCDFKKGTDREDRKGPLRVTQAGLVTPTQMISATVLVFLISILCCLWLVKRGGWPIAVIGVLSILSGIFYTAGSRPYAYFGLGEIFVFIFFGPVAVGGTYYVQSLEINPAVILAGLGPGLLSAAILVINNLRDREEDARAGKKTLAVRFGKHFAMTEYLAMIIAACLIPVLLYVIMRDHLAILSVALILFLAIPSIVTILTQSDGPSLNHALAHTGRLLLIYSLIFSIGWIL